MERGSRGLFAGRRIRRPRLWVSVVTVIAAFGLGIGAGYATGLVPGLYARWTAAPEVSASPSASASATPTVSVGPLAPIDRELDEADGLAGLISLVVPDEGNGTFSAVPGTTAEVDGGGPVRYVRIDVEDGLDVATTAFRDFVMDTLNDPRGWGSEGRQQFVLTDGAADIRIVLASPVTAAGLCVPTDSDAAADADGATSPSSTADLTCEAQGIVPLSLYDWAAGLSRYEDDRTGSRRYQLAHSVGYVLGDEAGTCTSGEASVMVVQETMPAECSVNPWPFPDAPVPEPSASA
ncbi:DUF3152 domain-containing protein [Demequina sp. SYSU T00039]|uniref:DUF3152 domain-containing protein n=1 Tax=Demequina lignilytica TaxID=3051663 RepID=A0AAW7M3E0_9MICO|nr:MULTISPECIES: DUF3152 domain-containing protein [unclassified Demequina]MDN4478231.1 DUF3152 domain-containing protein [Demequina sp. SYSU T00039-1]MDN4488319.1 DUF3152 domain-containing protein [Demequina sp. SYSU T00039]MDN4490134.1 DUF3152 domain-containing protein [Demequina sp. SYSU T00068]